MTLSEPISSATDSPPRDSLLTPLAIILTSRVGLILLAYLGLALLPAGRTPARAEPGNLLLDGWVKWDSFWYAQIAREGYTNKPIDASQQRDTGDLPLYPLAVRYLGKILGDVFIAGLLISNISFVLAGLLLYRLVESHWTSELARRTLVLLCVYPFSYTYTAMYTESLFLLCTLGAFCFAEKKWWLPAALCAAAAGATRVVGIASSVAVVLMYMQSIDWRWRDLRWSSLQLLTSFAGIGAFVFFLAIKFHEPLAFIHVHQAIGWGDFNSFQSLLDVLHFWRTMSFGSFVAGNAPILLTIHLLICVLAALICILAWRKLPLAYAAWATMMVLISYYRWGCFGRHFSTVFPAFIVMAMLCGDRRIYHGLIYLSALLLALFTLMFTHGLWVA
ncbi:MAG TPA: mannosyltransferase family protein [Tepidisphaeraceae bacterium]